MADQHAPWTKEHTNYAGELYRTDWDSVKGKKVHANVANLGHKAGKWPSGWSEGRVRKKLNDLCGSNGALRSELDRLTGRVQTPTPWGAVDDRKLDGLVGHAVEHGKDCQWAKWAKDNWQGKYNTKFLKARGKERWPVLVRKQQCAVGLSGGQRCPNTRDETEGGWRRLPNIAKVLSAAGVRPNDWKSSHYCCPDHGHRESEKIGTRNLPTKPHLFSDSTTTLFSVLQNDVREGMRLHFVHRWHRRGVPDGWWSDG